jgi:hypothetical protein
MTILFGKIQFKAQYVQRYGNVLFFTLKFLILPNDPWESLFILGKDLIFNNFPRRRSALFGFV